MSKEKMPHYAIFGDYRHLDDVPLRPRGVRVLDLVAADDEADALAGFLARPYNLLHAEGPLYAVRIPQLADPAFLELLDGGEDNAQLRL